MRNENDGSVIYLVKQNNGKMVVMKSNEVQNIQVAVIDYLQSKIKWVDANANNSEVRAQLVKSNNAPSKVVCKYIYSHSF